MSYKIRGSFPASISDEDVQKFTDAVNAKVGGAPAGIISHNEDVQNNQYVVIDEWESKEAFDAFMNDYLKPASTATGVPLPTFEEL